MSTPGPAFLPLAGVYNPFGGCADAALAAFEAGRRMLRVAGHKIAEGIWLYLLSGQDAARPQARLSRVQRADSGRDGARPSLREQGVLESRAPRGRHAQREHAPNARAEAAAEDALQTRARIHSGDDVYPEGRRHASVQAVLARSGPDTQALESTEHLQEGASRDDVREHQNHHARHAALPRLRSQALRVASKRLGKTASA